jgi:hypothetical protein
VNQVCCDRWVKEVCCDLAVIKWWENLFGNSARKAAHLDDGLPDFCVTGAASTVGDTQ